MLIEFIPLISFAVITTFTPGPNNISSASMGIAHGYRGSLAYLTGIASGFFLVLMACAMISHTLFEVLPQAEVYLKWIGAGYIFWLAIGTLRSGTMANDSQSSQAFLKGFTLQLVNPKVAIFGLTIYSTFLISITDRPEHIAASAFILAMNTFAAISTWTLFGAALRSRLANDNVRKIINMLLALMLGYTAVTLVA